MQKSDSIGELAKALAKAQPEIKTATKDSENPFFRSKYADLSAVWDACREALKANGLSVVQLPCGGSDQSVGLETVLLHESGEWVSSEVTTPIVKSDPQGIGSALTYLRRYGLSAMLGIVADVDDDGNAASRPSDNQKPRTKTAETAARDELTKAVRNAGKVLNELGDAPPWGEKRCDKFANENFNEKDGLKGLTNPQLGEMAALMSARIDALKLERLNDDPVPF